MRIDFHKMHGCGNDFIVINDPEGRFGWDALGELAGRHCVRRFAVGADGVIAVGQGPLAGEAWGDGADYEMRYVNADGSRAEMCGNGIRCVGKYVADVLGDGRDEVRVQTGSGVLPITLHRAGDGTVSSVTVGMGVPRLRPAEVPTTLGDGQSALRAELALPDATLPFTAVSMGNPHAVTFLDSITDAHVLGLGPQIETHPAFPRRTNVEFVHVLGPQELRMRVWERGVGETWACGTGACATAVAAILEGHSPHGRDIVVHLNGGDLKINWPAADQPVQMTGSAEIAYTGTLVF